ncbi:MAG: hypothetical protein FWF44_11420, partial [Defluviitaleaceae bacterium]|nr:hypothetical protein [Defluviitaleaceae bacterium]
FLREKKLSGFRATIEEFAETARVDDKKRRCRELRASMARAEDELAGIDGRQAEIWDMLTELNATDGDTGRIIGRMMEKYGGEAERVMAAAGKLD